MATGKRKILKEYLAEKESFDLHKLDKARNHDKVYHIAIAERPDGKFDVLCRYGRRGSGLQDFVAEEAVSISSARNIMYAKVSEKESDNYQNTPGITPGVWNDIFLPEAASQAAQPVVVEPQPEERPSLSSKAKMPDYAPPEWFY
jgi:hypothetical protein